MLREIIVIVIPVTRNHYPRSDMHQPISSQRTLGRAARFWPAYELLLASKRRHGNLLLDWHMTIRVTEYESSYDIQST